MNDHRYVLITGSRSWPMPYLVEAILDMEHSRCGKLTVMHGHCPSGADLMAHNWCMQRRFQNITELKRPADWPHCDRNCHHEPRMKNGRNHCPAAGPRRNQQMVDEMANYPNVITHAFIIEHKSRGTVDCVNRSLSAELEVVRHIITVP